ncbi:MAG: carbon-nitrogen hydrolase family protein [Armatimonadetes bacterium]|nr:carbon-nitrogen hydrolase family protein [Armatimonadota bacterium]
MARNVNVVSISFGGAGGSGSAADRVKNNLNRLSELVEEAATAKPDIVCLPEFCNVLGLGETEWGAAAETVPGPTTEFLGKLCRKHKTHLIIGMPERKGKRLYNSQVLLGRDGQPIGSYHKVHPTIGELDAGIRPGTQYTVLKADFGKVGFAICFDLNFRDVGEGAEKNGAEVLFFSSMYHGGLQNQIWAHDFQMFFVSSYCSFGSRIVNPLGRVIAESQLHYPFVQRTINLDYVVCHIDYNNQHWKPMKEKYGDQVELDVMSYEAKFILYSHHPKVTAQDLVKEFNLRTLDKYWEMERKARRAALGLTKKL